MPARQKRVLFELLLQSWWAVPLWVCLWFKELELLERGVTPGLDQSWAAMLGQQLLHGVRLGVDSVFTYGRLGWLRTSVHVPELYGWKMWGWELGFKLLLAGLCVLTVVRTRGWLARVCFALGLLVVPAGMDPFALVALLAACHWVLSEPERPWPQELFVLGLVALISQVKFTYFMGCAAALPLVTAALWISVSRRRALAFLLRALGMVAFQWLLFGQSLLDFPAWVLNSWYVASGYNDAMSIAGSVGEQKLAWAMIATTFAVLLVELARGPRSARSFAMAALVMLAAVLGYKGGFVRELGNVVAGYSVLAAASCFALAPPREAARGGVLVTLLLAGMRLFLVVGAAVGMMDAFHLRQAGWEYYFYWQKDNYKARWARVARIDTMRLELDATLASDKRLYALPRTRERVGRQSVDVLHSSQGIAILNDLEHRPRPVFQSYSAYTPELLALNQKYYERADGPRFVLFAVEALDGRMPAGEDCQAVETLLVRYHPVLTEHGYLLLERNAEEPAPERAVELVSGRVELGEWIDFANLEGEALELFLDVRRSLRGDLAAIYARGPALWCDFERENGSPGRVRILPRVMTSGVLIRPYLESQDQLLRLFSGERFQGLKRLKLRAAPGEEAFWRPGSGVRVVRREGLLPSARPESMPALRFPSFEPAPESYACAADVSTAEEFGQAVQVVHAPSRIVWLLAPGHYSLRGRFGLLDDAWRQKKPTDGAGFSVEVRGSDPDSRELFRRLLDPLRVEADRGLQNLELEFDVAEPSKLILRIDNGPANDVACDWTYWEGVKLTRS